MYPVSEAFLQACRGIPGIITGRGGLRKVRIAQKGAGQVRDAP